MSAPEPGFIRAAAAKLALSWRNSPAQLKAFKSQRIIQSEVDAVKELNMLPSTHRQPTPAVVQMRLLVNRIKQGLDRVESVA
jgi:hypothetical protein